MFRKILLTLDGSAMARRALPYVRDLARDSETEVCLLQVIDSRDDIVRQLAGDTADLSTADRKRFNERADVLHQLQRDEASRDLEDARRELEAAGVRSVATHVSEGHPAEEIVAASVRLDCDAIAMGARGHGHGRSGTGRDAIGSVAEAVVLNAGDAAVIVIGPRASGLHGPQLFGARTVTLPHEPADRQP